MKNSVRYASVQLLNIILSYVTANNYDLNTVLENSGIDMGILGDKDARVDMERFLSVISAIADISGDKFLGLHLAEKANNIYSKNHILMTIMANCDTLGKAVEKLIQYHDISSNSIKLHLENQGNHTALIYEADIPIQPDLSTILFEVVLTSCAIIFREFTLGKIRFIGIHFTHSELEDQSEYNRVFSCPVIFNSEENKVILSNEDLLLPIGLSDPELLSILELYAQKVLSKGSTDSILPERVKNCLSEIIFQGEDCNINNVAEKMAVSVRTLQKQLKEENTTYRKLVEYVKKNIAIKYLENTEEPLTDIAFLLGFSEQSAFNHAFKNWTGRSPIKYRINKNLNI